MANIGFFDRGLTKDVWHIVYDGTNEAAFTMISIENRSSNACSFCIAFGQSTLSQDQTATDADGFLEADTDSFLWSDELEPNEYMYFDSSQGGKILTTTDNKLAIAISGDGDLEINISGMEL